MIASQPGRAQMLAERTQIKIIVAEDQAAMRALLASCLRDAGYDVIEVSDGATLWKELHEGLSDDDNPRRADLIVSDVRMPGCSGLDVLALIRSSGENTPVILMTAFGDDATHAEASRLGAVRIFDKPFDLRTLVAAALRLVDPNPAAPDADHAAAPGC